MLPGLIGTHVHAGKVCQLEVPASWGMTTMPGMGNKDLASLAALKQRPGLPSLNSAGDPASAPGSVFVKKTGSRFRRRSRVPMTQRVLPPRQRLRG